MHKIILLATFLLCGLSPSLSAQQMDNSKLDTIINIISDEVEGIPGNWQFVIDSTLFICLTDEGNNRMRIISPVETVDNLTDEELLKCMEANFHSALDVKYSISDGIVWSVFIHPLAELSEDQVIDAISQVYSCVKTFRSTYSSGALSFPKPEGEKIERG